MDYHHSFIKVLDGKNSTRLNITDSGEYDSMVKNHWVIEYMADDAREKIYGTFEEHHIIKYGDVNIWVKLLMIPCACLGMLTILLYIG